MSLILAPVAVFFLASFLLTLPWYIRVRSVPAMVLGAVVQPNVCGIFFAFGIVIANRDEHTDAMILFQPVVTGSILFASFLAVPIALLCCIASLGKIRSVDVGNNGNAQDNEFVFFLVAGFACVTCAALAVATVLFLAR